MEIDSIEIHHKQNYFSVSLLKFSLMSICTFGFYEIYWNYKNWRFIKARDKSRISPFWRALFYPFWYFSLLKDIDRGGESKHVANGFLKIFLTAALLILSVLWRLPDPYWLISVFTFVPMLPAVSAINKIDSVSSKRQFNSAHRPLNFLAYLTGGPIILFVTLSTIGFFPRTEVIPGSALWERDLQYLRTQEILGEGEEILYFYSLGFWSIKEDGQFISEDYVTSYFVDPEDNSLYTAFSAYEDIESIDVQWSDSWLEDTVITITNLDGHQYEVWVSAESGGDKKFVDEMKRLWRANRDQ